MKKIIGVILIIIGVIVLGFIIFGNREQEVVSPNTNATSTENEIENEGETIETSDIRVTSPRMGATISSPLTIRGEARGPWYFEASFSGKLLNSEGVVISQFPIQAQGEWMTTDFVPFEETITWNSPASGNGTLVLENANASGLPENAKSVVIPIVFGVANQSQTLSVYFGKSSATNDCSQVFPIDRTVVSTQAVARASLEELLEGPTANEVSQGYVTSIPTGVRIQSLRIEDGTAYVDFNSALDEDVGGSCRVTAIRSQITETLKQFSTVSDVEISIDGRTEDILQP